MVEKPITRKTSTGNVLVLVKPSPDSKAADALEAQRAHVRAALQDAWALVQDGSAEEVCILAAGVAGVEILNTIPDLGELALARDELTDMIDDARRGE